MCDTTNYLPLISFQSTLISYNGLGIHSPVTMALTHLQCSLQSTHKARKANDIIRLDDIHSRVDISFQRTIRVTDGQDSSELPPSMGTFPLYPVSAYEKQLPEAMVVKGGVFLPMYRKSRA